jgi:hypothetical protein
MIKKFRYTKAIREIEDIRDKITLQPSTVNEIYAFTKCIKIINNNIVETEEINIEDDKYHDLLQKYIKLSDKYFDLQCKHEEINTEIDKIEKLLAGGY